MFRIEIYVIEGKDFNLLIIIGNFIILFNDWSNVW